jgi:hypothetical protein
VGNGELVTMLVNGFFGQQKEHFSTHSLSFFNFLGRYADEDFPNRLRLLFHV